MINREMAFLGFLILGLVFSSSLYVLNSNESLQIAEGNAEYSKEAVSNIEERKIICREIISEMKSDNSQEVQFAPPECFDREGKPLTESMSGITPGSRILISSNGTITKTTFG